jgi:hypothetical protein
VERAKRIERLARKIAGDSADAFVLEGARSAAQAELDLAQVREVKVAVIERERTMGEFDAPPIALPTRQTRMSIAAAKVETTEPDCLDEAVRRVKAAKK